jgi:hypothetical protein
VIGRGAFQSHRTVDQAAGIFMDFSTGVDPKLLPLFPDTVVAVNALTWPRAFPIFQQSTPIQDALDLRIPSMLAISRLDIPCSDPEIEFAICRRSFARRCVLLCRVDYRLPSRIVS